jgi:hypothetical protein
VRNEPVLVYRLESAERAGYALSPFERACAAGDSARALRASGASAALLEARARALFRLGRLEAAKSLMPDRPR